METITTAELESKIEQASKLIERFAKENEPVLEEDARNTFRKLSAELSRRLDEELSWIVATINK